ncbi:TonB-linked SusC/RagA family outer membrane protein [Chitinophaga niastensis]|uniref:TonB-linked SusC/RagA family outer membrane protein n=1 Tax=Chitinophaga niastensis TaxID=536980 RepID=A0A2P8HP26_CHINA|nr:TonB-dependent receptor [Chitinophaga niastensis]PSL47955.1 TonB-linked SusC/RagA family outer membrane protein [Chitinophaga niastensis]
MRITAIQIILATIFSLSTYANKARSQSVLEKPISISADQTSVRKLLSQIRNQIGVKFTYSSDIVDVNRKVSCKLESKKLKEFFDNVLKPLGIDFKVIDNEQILLYLSPSDHLSDNGINNVTVTGRVMSDGNEPMPGVSVRIKGSNVGTTTDVDGKFTLTVPDKHAVLVVSFIGFQQQEIAINDQVFIPIKLVTENSKLNEVVVVGYGTQRKKDITGAVSVVRADAFDSRPIVSAAAGLQGQAAGVNVSAPSGKPGSGLSISIRGNTSLNAKNDPLFVVDGVIVENIDFLNPSDIESFSVLKDASSAAIYGASGANGVVLVTTKKGIAGKSKIFVNTYTGTSSFAKKVGVLNTTDYKVLMTEMGYTDPNNNNTDWQKETFKTGREQNVQVGVSGGTESGHYYISGGYQKQKGVVAPADYDRYSVRANLDNKVKNWLTVGANLAFTRAVFVDVPDNMGVAKGGTILSALTSPPTLGIYNPDGTYTNNVNQQSWQNPIAYAFAPDQKSVDNRFLGNVNADFTILPELHFRSNLGVESQGNRYDYFLDPYSTDFGRSKKGYGKSQSKERFVWLWENTLNYTKQIGKHNITALIGHTMQESDYNYTNDVARGYSDGAVGTLNASSIRETQETTKSQWSKRSYLSRVNYGYADKYLLTANLRYDGSSRFPSNSRYGWFPSVAGAWRISNESFFNQNVFSDLKLRAGWGKTGNDGIGDYDYYATFSPNGTGGFNFNNLPKDRLTWETTTQTNIGVDAALLKGRITVTADAYLKKTSNMLVFVQTPPSSGFGEQRYNVGNIENKGVELGITALAIDKELKWNINGNISFNRNEVTSLGAFSKNLSYGDVYERGKAIRVEPGKPLGSFYGYKSEGVDPATGNIKYADLDGSKTLSDGDRTWIGNAQPDFIYGLTNTFSYKNFELSFFVQGVHGNDIFNASRIELEGLYDSKNQSTAVLRRWKNAGDVTDIPKATKGNTDNSLVSSRFVENGAYVRMKSATLSYKFTGAIVKKAGFSRLNLYVTGQNLFTITKYSGIDPEVSQNSPNGPGMGIDYGTYPQARAFIFGLNAEF